MTTKAAFSAGTPSILSFSMTQSGPSTSPSIAKQFTHQCTQFDIKDMNKIRRLITALEGFSQLLAQNPISRVETGIDSKLWPSLRRLWRDLSRQLFSSSFWDNDDDSSSDEGEQTSSPPTSPLSTKLGSGIKANGQGHTRDPSNATTTSTTSHASAKQRRKQEEDDKQAGLRALCASLAKFTRNLVAGVKENQAKAFENEPDIRRLLHYYTSWTEIQDGDSVIVARLLTQALSNLVTSHDALVDRLWATYMSLPEDEGVIIRLMQSTDQKTLLTTLIFILNCIHKNKKRTEIMIASRTGVRVCINLLDSMVKLHDAEDQSDGAKAFDIGYAIVREIIEAGSAPDLYRKFRLQTEVITPHQTTLLKLIDSYLQSTQSNIPLAAPTPSQREAELLMWSTHSNLGPFLAKRFFELGEYAQEGMVRALGMTRSTRPNASTSTDENGDKRSSSSSFELRSPVTNSVRRESGVLGLEEDRGSSIDSGSKSKEEPKQHDEIPSGSKFPERARSNSSAGLQQLDTALPVVCEALVLIAQCMVTISLEAEEESNRRVDEKYRKNKLAKRQTTSETRTLSGVEGDYREYLARGMTSPRDAEDAETVVGKDDASNATDKAAEWVNMKEYFNRKRWESIGIVESLIEILSLLDVFLPRINFGKPVNRDGTPMTPSYSKPTHATTDPSSIGFSYLKRDLVRLLGVLSAGEKSVQDRTRDAGGLPVVMNLCVVDERNPFLREHAIFTLHNLLKDNPENQKFVDSVKPSQEWAADGTLKTKVGAKILK